MGLPRSYREAGVDVDRIAEIHRRIAGIAKRTFKAREDRWGKVLMEIGHYAGLIDIGGGKALAMHVDGVGTKVLIAQMMGRYDTIGIDCVAMCVNDVICVGAEPVALVDYLVVEEPREDLVEPIMEGLVRGAEEAGVAIVGGETAVMKDVVKGVRDGYGFDLAAMCIGVVDRGSVLYGDRIGIGDYIVGLASNGIHSNGLTLARKILIDRYGIDRYVDEIGCSIGEELLKPTKIYVKPVLEVLRRYEVHGLAHITGGAFGKLMRLARMAITGFYLDSMPEPPSIFKLIQKLGGISDREMYRTFNMGVGFCIIAPKSEAEDILDFCEKKGYRAWIIGRVCEENTVKVKINGEDVKLV
ncbi:MAG: phosphoribosylformylglycinamidine cyclo-ligase [Nitrososphaerota archaeon]|nr:phosphoribosylformylglycinamidine cyclo-ligase [Candidatus Bathyarchaeota archaeon]MDW8062023.1 phosphoribosylformylglycinamidine cyclo-ligase [Nitrososphaerota archaeon]